MKENKRKLKLLKQKEAMKKIQEKNTTKAPKNILYRCFPSFFYRKCLKCANQNNKAYKYWEKIRRFNLKIVESTIFEIIIMITIFLSSLTLTFEDVNLKIDSTFYNILRIFDYIFTGIFVIEMLFKWLGIGLKKYFTDPWCILDFIIVIVLF